ERKLYSVSIKCYILNIQENMNKKNGLIISSVLLIVVILLLWGDRLGLNTIFPRILIISVALIIIHYLLYVLVKRMKHPKTINLFLITIFFGLITLIFMIPFVLNFIHNASNNGGFNEDYSGVFLMIASMITLLSFTLSYFFKRKLLKLNK
ncbi:MAG: hypothetical protein NUK62_05525, partial [Tenericutes bacterium]|nr:hypothetical protein [Mycoplasmatota bacterium]